MKISRKWGMPNKNTFDCKPIGEFVHKYLSKSKVSIDPFARNKNWCTYTNDLNKDTTARYHMECEDFLQMIINKNISADLIVLDPPYSPRQIKECYDSVGLKMQQHDAWGGATMARRKRLINQIVPVGGVVLKFGWNSNGMGKNGWIIEEILLVSHGSAHNDTICMAERRINKQLKMFEASE